jgi:hypothetical protein
VRLRDVKVCAGGSHLREGWGLALLPNPLALTADALKKHLDGFYSMYDKINGRRDRFEEMTAVELRTLKSLVPAECSALLDFLLTKVGVDPAVLEKLGITERRAMSVNKRFGAFVSQTAPRIHERIQKRLAKQNGVAVGDVTVTSVRSMMRRAVRSAGLLKNTLLGAASRLRRVDLQMPELRVIMQQAARAAGAVQKSGCEKSFGTPTDELIFEAAWGGPGGQIDRLTLIAQHYLADQGLSRQRGTIAKALREYEIRFNRVKHTLTPLRLEQYYCANRMKTQKQLAALFSAICRRGSCDACKLFRCDALSNASGGAATMTVQAATVQGPDHDQGGDHRSKIGAYGVYFLPAVLCDLESTLGLFPRGFDASASVEGWSKTESTMERPGLACVLGHVERLGGETAARNWQDRLEVLTTYEEDFLTPGAVTCRSGSKLFFNGRFRGGESIIIIIMSNNHRITKPKVRGAGLFQLLLQRERVGWLEEQDYFNCSFKERESDG